jgi:hypothetical protein
MRAIRCWVCALLLILPGAARADRYLLVIGVNYKAQKKGQKDKFAVEARQIRSAFRRHSGGLPGRTLTRSVVGRRATRGAILRGLRWLEQMGPQDRAFVYVSMHGAGGRAGFTACPVGYVRARGQQTGVTGEDLHGALGQLPGPSVLCLDTCHSGLLLRHEPEDWGKCLVITSCRANEKAYVRVMSPVLREALSGRAASNRDGRVTFGKLGRYLARRIPRRKASQHPVILDHKDERRVVLTRPARSRRLARRVS